MPKSANPLVLDPDDEFEAVIVDVLKMHRKKSAQYGSDADPLNNFIIGGEATNTTPLRYGEALIAKHQGAIRQWFAREPQADQNPKHTGGSNDAYIDRVVYAILLKILYDRQKQS